MKTWMRWGPAPRIVDQVAALQAEIMRRGVAILLADAAVCHEWLGV